MTTATHRILLAIADELLRRSVALHLRQAAGLAVTEAAGADDVLALADGHHLAVVDEALDGPALCRRLRDDGATLPLLLLGANGAAPCCGVEAVVAKPLRLTVLATRIRELLSRQPIGPATAIGSWHFDESRSALTGPGGALVRLTAKETAILRRLLDAGQEPVGRQILLDEVWGYGAGIDTHTLETHIYKLRRKLGAGILLSEAGGYRLAIAGS